MLRSRIIPCLLVKNRGLVKTINFQNPKYVGDPINAVKIFNEKEADELMVLDIDATPDKREPDYRMIEDLAAECRMPLCYGGGVRTAEQALKIISLGVEKVALSTAVLEDPSLVTRIAKSAGSQSVAVVLDVKESSAEGKYEIWRSRGQKNTQKCPFEFARQLEKLGVGEIIMNSIERDGLMKGYDLSLAVKIREAVSLPLTMLGGAGSLRDMEQLIAICGTLGAAAGSFFVFKGVYRAVLIHYPSKEEKDAITGKTRRLL